MAILSWGKPRIWVKNLAAENAPWVESNTPVENSTQLSTTKGTKTEAKIEGGENEGVRYSKNTYALTFNLRTAAGRKPLIESNDGIVDDPYAVMLQPENPSAPGLYIENSTASVEDGFTTADGGTLAYTFDALKPDSGSNQVKWGLVAISKEGEPKFTEAKYD